jgi:hypothetical protein
MTDYELTAGQQQSLTDFLNLGKSIYVEGTDFGYFHETDPIYKMFGCTLVGDGSPTNNVVNLTGITDSLADSVKIDYTYGSAYPDQYVDYLASSGGDMLFACQGDLKRAVAYAGPNGTYRAIHSAFWFGAMKDTGATDSKNKIMAAYMRYLMQETLVVGVQDEVSVINGGEVELMLETNPTAAGRTYAVLGSLSGTSPGTPVGSVVLPLKYDAFFVMVQNNLNSSIFHNFYGQLDASGRALATLNVTIPVNPSLAGLTANFAFVLLGPANFASNAAPVQLVQ